MLIPITTYKRTGAESGYAEVARGKKAPQTINVPTKEPHLGALLAVLLLIIILGILGFAVVKILLWIAAILLIIWLVGFFMRGAEGRWYRW
jgi:hypothetical protein